MPVGCFRFLRLVEMTEEFYELMECVATTHCSNALRDIHDPEKAVGDIHIPVCGFQLQVYGDKDVLGRNTLGQGCPKERLSVNSGSRGSGDPQQLVVGGPL